jgi:hypothetical protein
VKRIFIFACFSWNPETDKFPERLHICVWHSRLPLLSPQENNPSANHTENNFPFMYSQKYLAMQTKYFQCSVLSRIMIFWREVQYKMQPFSSQHREQHISKRNYEISVVHARDS